MIPPFFSVILPTFNRLSMLQEAIASVQQQSFADYELIVVDDGSTDGTRDYLMSLSSPIRSIATTHGGPGAARNAALAEATGTWIAFLDSDDAWFPWTLATYHSAIQSNPQAVFLTGTATNWDSRHPTKDAAPSYTAFPHLLCATHGDMPPVSGTPSICIRADVLRRVGGFAAQNINAEDVDLWLRLGYASQFVQIHEPAVFAQRKHTQNVTDDLRAGIAGAHYLIRQERSGAYPGGSEYAIARRRIIAANTRSVILHALRFGNTRDAWSLFRQTFDWQLKLHRWRFLAAFPLLMVRGLTRKAQSAERKD